MNKESILIAVFILSFVSFSIFVNAYTIQDFADSISQFFSNNQNNATIGGFDFYQWLHNIFPSTGCKANGVVCSLPSDCCGGICYRGSCAGSTTPTTQTTRSITTTPQTTAISSRTTTTSSHTTTTSQTCSYTMKTDQARNWCLNQCGSPNSWVSCITCGLNGCQQLSCFSSENGINSASCAMFLTSSTTTTPSSGTDPCTANGNPNGSPKSGMTYACKSGQQDVLGGTFDCKDSSGSVVGSRSCSSSQNDVCHGPTTGSWPCQKAPAPSSCTDSDNPDKISGRDKNPILKGTCTGKTAGGTDNCFGDTLNEFYCSDLGYICPSYQVYCPDYCTQQGYKSGKCSDGACICESGTTTTCDCNKKCQLINDFNQRLDCFFSNSCTSSDVNRCGCEYSGGDCNKECQSQTDYTYRLDCFFSGSCTKVDVDRCSCEYQGVPYNGASCLTSSAASSTTTTSSATSTNPQITIDRTNYYQGTNINFVGTGFTPNGQVRGCMTTNYNDGWICGSSSTADNQGKVSGPFQVGYDIPAEAQKFHVEDSSSQKSSNNIQVQIFTAFSTSSTTSIGSCNMKTDLAKIICGSCSSQGNYKYVYCICDSSFGSTCNDAEYFCSNTPTNSNWPTYDCEGSSTTTPGSISGSVTDATTGQGISGLGISATLSGSSPPAASTTTDNSGKYQLNNLNPGIYFVEVSGSGWITSVSVAVKVDSGRETIYNMQVTQSQTGTSQLSINYNIHADIMLSILVGNPIQGKIRVDDNPNGFTANTISSGTARLITFAWNADRFVGAYIGSIQIK